MKNFLKRKKVFIVALIKCIECGNDVSEYAEACPKCGCPISVIKSKTIEIQHEENNPISNEKCPICSAKKPHIITDNIKETCSVCGYVFNEDYVKKHKDLLPKAPVPKCPTCGSTDIRKISTTSKAVSVGLFGIFSSKIRKQFHCNSCKYEW